MDSEDGGEEDDVVDENGSQRLERETTSEIDDTIVVDSHFQSRHSPMNQTVEDDIEKEGRHDEDMEGDNNEDPTGEV